MRSEKGQQKDFQVKEAQAWVGFTGQLLGTVPAEGRNKPSTTCAQLSARHIKGSLLGSRVTGAFIPWH